MKKIHWLALVRRSLPSPMARIDVDGFTLIELIVVIALVCVIASLTLVNTSYINRFAVRADVEKFVSTCRFLRQMAMSTNAEQKLVFNLEENSYAFSPVSAVPVPSHAQDEREENNVSTERLSKNVRFGLGKRTILGPPSAPTKPITQAVTYTDNTIFFYPDGVIKSGAVYFSDVNTNYVYAVSSPVSSISFLRTYVYDGSWKLLK